MPSENGATWSDLESLFAGMSARETGSCRTFPKVPREADTRERDERFKEAMERLADASAGPLRRGEVESLSGFFISLYGDDPEFRHMYSSICDVVYSRCKDAVERSDSDVARGEMPASIASLSESVAAAMRHIENGGCGLDEGKRLAVLKRLRKAHDHIQLECIRSQQLVDANLTVARVEEKASKKVDEEIAGVSRKMQRDYIAILGIFAAVVMVFNGSIGFANSAVTAVSGQPTILGIALMADLAGLVLVNAVWVLLVFIWKLVRGDEPIPVKVVALIVSNVVMGLLFVVLLCKIASQATGAR